MLHGRSREQADLAALLDGARSGRSAALVLRGEPGIGKTALLAWAAETAAAARVLRAEGVEVEADLPFAALSQLLRPALPRLGALPAPQRAALDRAFGLAVGEPGDRLLIGLAVLSLLADLAEDGPVLCLVDDAQWLDTVSAEALVFAARRLDAEGVVLLFAARDGGFAAPGLPELRLAPLEPQDAARLLPGSLDPATRLRVLAEAAGNPLALRELPLAAAGAAHVNGGPVPLTRRLLDAFHGQVGGLPAASRALLLAAAAEDTGDLDVVLRAGALLGADAADLRPAERLGLVAVGTRTLRFRHPLVRTAVYREAPLAERMAAHQAIADVSDSPEQADRRAWHLAAATTGTREEIAAALEETAARARERGGYAAAVAAYTRAAELSEDDPARAGRLLAAAELGVRAGDMAGAVELAERAGGLHAEPPFLARVAGVEALAWFWQGGHPTAHDLLLAGADLDPERAPEPLIQAFHTAWYLGGRALAELLGRLADVDHPLARLLVAMCDDTAPPPPLGAAIPVLGPEPRMLAQVCGAGFIGGQDAATHELAARLTAQARADGAFGLLPTLLFYLAEAELFHGGHRAARADLDDCRRIAADTGQRHWTSQAAAVSAVLAALEGDAEGCRALTAAALAEASPGVPASGLSWTYWAAGLLDLGLGRTEQALDGLLRLQEESFAHQVCARRSIPDLVEAAVRAGSPDRARPAAARFAAWADRIGQPWARALALRCRALLDADEAAYTAALGLDGRPMEQARTRLLYGEWLRRARRRAEARPHLAAALETFDGLGATPWADRARAELAAAGALPASDAPRPAGPALTPQELQIVRLAASGLSNKDIAARLFLSPRTVGYHLYKAYPKLGVTDRRDLAALPL
ncbi:regulatory LuxR family protein [Actinocorallia herbida]|uniref:Regulatory LuxR family protein n=1 Tax=Actinocorallia herbida TaxID=58109 RepID=A0A3N1CTC4_9ACTN|nr:LuxR family transcriptional regulator [Actinocorallia herbida]ROO84465.1 regulatory LuxR family protein [Actinocorallia herbida]